MKTDAIEINDRCKIKKPEPSDLEYEILYKLSLMPAQLGRPMPSAIMAIEYRAKSQPEILRKIEGIVIALRLFKVGSIVGIKTEWNPISLFQPGGTSSGARPLAPTFKYELNKDDENKLRTFFEIIEPKIPLKVVKKDEGETSFITIAFDRYNDSLLGPNIPESRLASAIMCLEALYLKDEERGELAERLSQRTAITMSFFDYNPFKVFKTIKKSYEIRSRFVHGSKIDEKTERPTKRLIKKVIDYARVSIIMFLQIQETIGKNKFIDKLNNSLLDENAKEDLSKDIKSKCQVPER